MRLAPQTSGVGEHEKHVPLLVGLGVVGVSGVHHRPMNKTFKSDRQAEGLGDRQSDGQGEAFAPGHRTCGPQPRRVPVT